MSAPPKFHGINQDAIRLLMRVSMMLSEKTRFDESDSILRAISNYRPEIPHSRVCLVVGMLYRQKHAEAIEELDLTLKKFPNCAIAKAILGFALRDHGSPKWKAVLQEVLDDDRDVWAVNFAKELLQYSPPDTSLGAPASVLVYG